LMKTFVTKTVFLVLFTLWAGALHSAYAAHPAQLLLKSGNGQETETPLTEKQGIVTGNQNLHFSGEKSAFLGGLTIAGAQVALEQFLQVLYWRLDILLTANLAKVPYDLSVAMDRISQGSGVAGFVKMFQVLVLVFTLAFAVEYLFRKLILNRFQRGVQTVKHSGFLRFCLILSRAIPEFMALGLFVGAAYTFYVLIYAEFFSGICPLYLSMQATIISARSVSIVSRILFSPTDEQMRLLPFDNTISRMAHRSVQLFAWLVAGGMMFVFLLKHAGLTGDSELVIRICYGSILIVAVVMVLVVNRKQISGWIRGDEITQNGFRAQIAGKWLPVALCYIASLWVLWVIRLLIVGPEFGFAFAISFLIVPIFLILDSFLGWFQDILFPSPENDGKPDLTEDKEVRTPTGIASYFRTSSRIVLVFLLGLWMFSLWKDEAVLSESTQIKGMEEDVDSEWGDAPMLDRGQTLLPLLQKFIGIAMLVLVVLFVLSTLGVNIAHLLAGAGVVGIAIGFGAQKLVSDVLSGFFYLLDDAFRVGEYIKTSSISGAVEKITLRNVMLRHHRGMLQIVPYSDLGAITNYMRGGIVVKFNLQFPYDTDVDQVRKVIKRVGITMLEDPEFGKNFIKQVKSQGIREVADSVLTIRVKFTAHPGTHFLIRREAYRRITEALAAKGIFYAHRKVIVEVPESAQEGGRRTPDEARKRLAEAGAAAQLATENNEEEAKDKSDVI